jgi:co-chaperonin GroES (HSP10)
MTPRAIGEHIWVIKDPKKETMEGGILIPEGLERTPRYGPTVLGTVVSVGGRVKELRIGQRIALKDIAGDDYHIDDKTYTHLRERDIVGIAHE